jgi:O-acetyl-ADP-ribose deacetylase (regulator of RNase III)
MIEYSTGDIFESGCDILVNACNIFGVSGAGIALEFKKRFPKHNELYVQMCKYGRFRPGRPEVITVGGIGLIYFPTKSTWRLPSQLSYIRDGLNLMRFQLLGMPEVKSVAIPALGCGLGQLLWSEVKPLIEYNLQETFLPGRRVVVFEPK